MSDFGNPTHSLATLRSPDDPSPRARRFRGSVGRRRVVYVGENPLDGKPTVWLTEGWSLCRAVLGEPGPSGRALQAHPAQTRSAPEVARFARYVERLDDSTFRIDRGFVTRALGNTKEIQPGLRGVVARLVPSGVAFSRVSAGSIPSLFGIESGDRVVAIDGRPLSGMEDVLGAYATLPHRSRVTLTVERGGSRRDLSVRIE